MRFSRPSAPRAISSRNADSMNPEPSSSHPAAKSLFVWPAIVSNRSACLRMRKQLLRQYICGSPASVGDEDTSLVRGESRDKCRDVLFIRHRADRRPHYHTGVAVEEMELTSVPRLSRRTSIPRPSYRQRRQACSLVPYARLVDNGDRFVQDRDESLGSQE